jgi:hypothetical protein
MGKGIMKKMDRQQQKAVGASMSEAAGKMAKDSAGYMAHGGKKDGAGKMSRELTYGGPVIDQMGNALSHMGAMKVLKHSKSRM